LCSKNLTETMILSIWNFFLFFIVILFSYQLIYKFSLLENALATALFYFVSFDISVFIGILSFYFNKARLLFIFLPFILLIFFMFLYFYTQNLNINLAIINLMDWMIPKHWLMS
jgi:hypothetical protein